ncbi:DUF7159 family protein [Mycobacterium sp.]|uniref:DUF7159 family protein n=1 Tax=Mycobacterium sp. TaxID=1785 RepID=UPI002C9DCA9C|nr:hypothetical protein [Mycobacterium sp.]HKP43343.1 hypothetical protein [Mycobacterium sp.]
MDLVLGLSMTSADVRWALVEGATAEGATICRDAADSDTLDDVLSAVGDHRLHAIGVTWTAEAEAAASTLLDALADRGLGNVIAVSDTEAADMLATGIADRGGYDDVAVCIVEPDGALVTRVDRDGVTTERTEPTADDMLAMLDRSDDQPAAIFVLGSADDIESIVSSFDGATEAPVISAAEADLALARGAALASARAVNALDAPDVRLRWPSKSGALASVLVAAVVTFVVSLSIALGLRLTPDSTVAQRQAAAEQPARMATAPSVPAAAPHPQPPAAPPPPPAAPPPPPEAPPEAEKIAVAALPEAPPPAAEPVYDPPAAAPPAPAPVYVPPAPAYVPPPPQPRLRDRIIERIPIINRFHEPDPYG